MTSPARRLSRSPYFWLLLVFAVSRALYFAAGVRFDSRPLGSFFQFLDPELLRTRLLESLFYMHTQPPGFNAFVGVVVKLFPTGYTTAFHIVFLACGVSLLFTIYRLLRIFDVRPALAAVLVGLFMVSPGVVLFENFLIYEYPLMALLCATALLFHSLLARPAPRTALLFFTCILALVYIRALFHLGYFVLMIALSVYLLKGRRRMILTAAAVPFLLALGLYVKNWAVFGTFSSSTWMGFNADTITLHQLTEEEHNRLVASGLLSRVGLIPSTAPLSAYSDYVRMPAPWGIPVLDQLNDSTGRVNYNHLGYLALHPYYLRDAKAIVLHYPRVYLRSVVKAWFAYFLPTSDFPNFDLNRPRIRRFDRIFNIVFFGQWKDASDRKNLRRLEGQGSLAQLPLYTGTYLLIGLPLLFLWGLYRLWQAIRTGGWRRPATPLLAFLLFHIAFLTAAVNLLSSFENNRYRLPLDPFFLALLGMAIERILRGAGPRPAHPAGARSAFAKS